RRQEKPLAGLSYPCRGRGVGRPVVSRKPGLGVASENHEHLRVRHQRSGVEKSQHQRSGVEKTRHERAWVETGDRAGNECSGDERPCKVAHLKAQSSKSSKLQIN